MKKTRCIIPLLLAALLLFALAGCGGGSGSSVRGGGTGITASSGSHSKIISATQANPFVTPLIAGGGSYYGAPGQGELATNSGSGTVVGDVKVWNDGVNLHVLYETTSGWALTETHLYVGDVQAPNNHPGQFPWVNEGLANVTSYEYVIPLTGNYPNHGFDANLPYNWPVNANLYILAQAEVINVGSTGLIQGPFATIDLWGYNQQKNLPGIDILVGSVTCSISGTNLVVHIALNPPFPVMNSDRLSIGVNPPPYAPGAQDWQHSPLGGVATDEYILPLSGTYDDGTTYNWIAGQYLYFCFEVNGNFGHYYNSIYGPGTADWATAWDLPNRFNWATGDSPPKSYTEICLPGGGGGSGGTGYIDTAWAKGNAGTDNGFAYWFRNYVPFGNGNWGWWFNYLVT